jgi:ABC-2 type transport system permease protein
MDAVSAIFGLTIREAFRRRLVLAAVVIGVAFVSLHSFALSLLLNHAPCGPASRPCHTAYEIVRRTYAINMLALSGVYVANFLIVMAAVLLPIDTLSGEIDSGIAQTLASKPIRRVDIVLGKWLAHAVMMLAYLLLTAGGLMLAVWLVTHHIIGIGFVFPRAVSGLSLMLLEALIMMTVSIAGGTRLSTITNGMIAFGVFGIAFLGGWLEQLGELFAQTNVGRLAIRDIGTAISLISPADAIWRLAASQLMPAFARDLGLTPFTPLLPPSAAMAMWGALYALAVFALGLRWFYRRAL